MNDSNTAIAPRMRRPLSSAWALAAVLITLLLVVGIPAGYVLITWSRTVAGAPGRLGTAMSTMAVEAIRPRLTMNEIVMNSIQDLNKKSKLAVFETVQNADVTREEGLSSWGMYWGTNVARVTVRDARAQFVIDLADLGTSDVRYNDAAKVLTISVPRPRIDTQMISIDPAKIQTMDLRGGWARFDKQETRDRAIAELRPKIITQAQVPFVQDLADDKGLEAMTRLMQPLADAVARDGVTVRVAYRD